MARVVATFRLRGRGVVMSILYFLHRNARIALVVAIAAGALGAAGTIGWITAPV